jgi:hypothetical protein
MRPSDFTGCTIRPYPCTAAGTFNRQEQKELKAMKKAILVLLFLGCGTLFAGTHFSVGIGIGGYGPVYAPAPPPPVYEQPPCPGEGYIWVDGYWNPLGGRYYWRPGYWRAPAYYGYRGGRAYDYSPRGYDRGYSYRERGGYDRYDRGGRGWDRGNRGGYGRNEFRHEDGRGRHEERDWRR